MEAADTAQHDVSPELAAKAAEARRLPHLPVDQKRFSLVYSPMPSGPNELAVNSCSMLQILGAFSSFADVPDAHVQDHSASPSFSNADITADDSTAGVRIRSGHDKPENAFTAVRYRDYWFWIDEGDWRTKRALAAVMFFFTLADTGGNGSLPLITIPAQ